ncbi:probable 28S ribosomal protein S25, mitochondrial [Pollicipes pollicipes]|uniref:probable 28S ribosomal protein S25, mitochondrial n=1 Tax=Pollicipes pollicipes TaxID=41117 RepID=UPI00188505FF|nr:probable 28S ribosomal protein S25, mitochondrial [Pollicipes pollicipes]XP_037070658.1 probable 28S ribosomal protein S25, mitochondrial [Pollicipes pollicipes]XP_037070659.1 probable 28S ribosomal protein S25, mitochondrial [Pollicipes pollicipes]
MPFRLGTDPIRHTLQYLEKGPLVFKERVRVMLVHYNQREKSHKGVEEFLHWYTPQIQYKNPSLQLVAMKNVMPSTFIRLFLDNDEEVLVNAEGKSKEDILSHLTKILGKSASVLAAEQKEAQIVENVSNFGEGCGRHCICEVPGQVPCPGIVPLPKEWRGKYKYGDLDD